MIGLVGEPMGSVATAQDGSATFPSQAFDDADWLGTSRELARWGNRHAAEQGIFDPEGFFSQDPEPQIPAEDANRQYGIPGKLQFNNPVPASVAQQLYNTKRDELMRQDAASRAPSGFGGTVARAGAGFVTGMLDPVNIAASFVPVMGEARLAGTLGTVGARAVAGAVSGAVSQAPLVGIHYALAQQEQADYSATDAMADIAMGGLLGGGLHTLIGGAGDFIGRRFGRSPAAAAVEDSPAAREAALRSSVAAVAEGRPVSAAPVIDATEAEDPVSNVRARAPAAAAGNYAAFTPSGLRVEVKPELAEAGDLVTSHFDDGRVNPDYPHADGMQPRDRTSLASQSQIAEMAAKLEPTRLGPSPEASTGAPIVNQDGVVESGNGRTMAMRRMYGDPAYAGQADAYRAHLTAQGYDIEGLQQPVLIGRRQTALTPDQARDFARSANERTTLGLSTAETARMDAQRAGSAIADLQPGPIGGAVNRDFVRGFMAQVPAEERGSMIQQDGRLSANGEQRIRSALLAHAYGDSLGPTLERMLNGETENMRSLAGGLTDASGAWGKLRTAAADGTIPPGLDITPALGEAVQIVDRARQLGRPVSELLAQGDMLPPSDAAQALLHLFYQDAGLRRPLPRAELAELLNRYVDQAMEAKPGPDLFGSPETTPGDILRAIGGGDRRFDDAATALRDTMGTEPAQRALGKPDPEDTAVAQAATAAAAKPAENAAAEPADLAGLLDTLKQADARGALTAADRAELAAAAEARSEAEGTARALEAATSCMTGRL